MLMMLPFEAPTIFEGIHKSYFRMPRVVKDQRGKFENDDLFRQLSHESAVKYTGFKDRPLEERQIKFIASCQEGHTEISVVQSGNQFSLSFNPLINPTYNNEGCDFDKELGKVHIKSGFILNGVCVLWRGWIDLQRLEGFGCLEFDEYRAYMEDAMLKQEIDKQQTCNSGALAAGPLGPLGPPPGQLQSSPLSRLNHHPLGPPPPPPHLGGPLVGLNPPPPGCGPGSLPPVGHIQGPPGPPPPGPPPPVSLADSAAHYGNAAIAAAAAAAFHQALSASAGPPPHLAGLGLPVPPVPAPYSNGLSSLPSGSPPSSQQPTNNGSTPNSNRSPERDLNTNQTNATNNNSTSARLNMKRSREELQTQLDDVDVVSDIHAHDLDFPPRRIFKSEGLPTAHHHHHHHHHHRATRRAA